MQNLCKIFNFKITFMILGLNEFAIRLPSAIFGMLTVFLSFILARNQVRDGEFKHQIHSLPLFASLITLLLMTISPWHIQYFFYLLKVIKTCAKAPREWG